jgi:hypothetical protein
MLADDRRDRPMRVTTRAFEPDFRRNDGARMLSGAAGMAVANQRGRCVVTGSSPF